MLLLWFVFLFSLTVQGQSGDKLPVYQSEFEKQLLSAYKLGKPVDPLALLLVADKWATEQQYIRLKAQLTDYIAYLQTKRSMFTRDKAFIGYLFSHSHKQFLKKFEAYQPFSKLYSEGVYNCISATAWFALLLDGLGYTYQLKETPFHLYLIVTLPSGKRLLLESTDPKQGILSGKARIRNREIYYGEPDSTSWCAKAALCTQTERGACPTRYLNPITLTELCGLQYYNQAVLLYNQLNLKEATQWLRKAALLYPTARRTKGLQAYIQAEQVKNQALQTRSNPLNHFYDRK